MKLTNKHLILMGASSKNAIKFIDSINLTLETYQIN